MDIIFIYICYLSLSLTTLVCKQNIFNSISMLSLKQTVKTTLLCGSIELSKTFMFQTAFYWATEGNHVLYITTSPFEAIPTTFHEKHDISPAVAKLVRFMYLSDYKSLVEQLIKLHMFASVPFVIIIDNLDNYLKDNINNEKQVNLIASRMHIARRCSTIFDAMNSCSRVLNVTVHICAWSSVILINDITFAKIYFYNIWNVSKSKDGIMMLVKKVEPGLLTSKYYSFKYQKSQDGIYILKNIMQEFNSIN